MAYIQLVPDQEAQGATARIYKAAKDRSGGIANIVQIMGLDGESAAGSMAFYIALMKRKNSLSAPQKEMLAAVVSNANDCFY